MKKRAILKLARAAICCAALAGAFALVGVSPAQAAAYKAIPLNNGKVVVKSGNYYFKVKNNLVYVSTKKAGGFKKTPMEWDKTLLCNGEQIYYSQNHKLYRYTLASGQNAKLKSLKSASYIYHDVSAVYKSSVYISFFSDETGIRSTYRYDTETGDYVLQYKKCLICAHSGSYAVGQSYLPGDVSPYPLTLYRLDGTGMHKVKKLASYGMLPTFAGGKLYYCVYPKSGSMSRTTLYRSDKNGSGKTKIVTLKEKAAGSTVTPIKITASYVNYIDGVEDLTMYRYTYATGKTKRITSNK